MHPAHLEQVGTAISEHPEVAYLAAVTGPANLTASVVCRDNAHLYRYVTERLGALPGINDIEVTPALRIFKQSQSLIDARKIAVAP
ncbi:Lrp/AsnC family transcriptional regulator [Nocardia aurantiaca]|uniref:Transcription regulator AsnC/Lrp ligand binding domain-containing protein n=1 Tax=Nocardia aurantiaca TaxID=2675850 RepID=A0A6I3KVS8_9NOCA|nr:hypothetical protein [Nocardia aurantiaca]